MIYVDILYSFFQGASIVLTMIILAIVSFYFVLSLLSRKKINKLGASTPSAQKNISIDAKFGERLSVVEPRISENGKDFLSNRLDEYYSQVLFRAKLTFLFSIVFSTIGFGYIIWAISAIGSTDIQFTIIKLISGTLIDAVSALFFFQSTSAHKYMSEFFEKLRRDNFSVIARSMIDEIENPEIRDQVREKIILKYSAAATHQGLGGENL